MKRSNTVVAFSDMLAATPEYRFPGLPNIAHIFSSIFVLRLSLVSVSALLMPLGQRFVHF